MNNLSGIFGWLNDERPHLKKGLSGDSFYGINTLNHKYRPMKFSLLSASKCDYVRIISLRLLTNNSLHDIISTIYCTRELKLLFCVAVNLHTYQK